MKCVQVSVKISCSDLLNELYEHLFWAVLFSIKLFSFDKIQTQESLLSTFRANNR
jgi:hypothetical protein